MTDTPPTCFGKVLPYLSKHLLSSEPLHKYINLTDGRACYDEEYFLHNDLPSGRVLRLFLSKSQSDIVLVLEKTGEKFLVHKLILSMTSPVMEAIIIANRETPEIFLDDSPDSLKWIILHAYTDYLDIPSDIYYALELYEVLKKYRMKSTVLRCIVALRKLIKVETIDPIYKIALQYNDKILLDGCLEMIESCGKDILKYAENGCISINLLKAVIQEETLFMSEIDIFKYVIRWGKSQERRLLKEGKKYNLRNQILSLLPEIDFLSMDLDEIVEVVLEENIFSDEEIVGILLTTKRVSRGNLVNFMGDSNELKTQNTLLNSYPKYLNMGSKTRYLILPISRTKICDINTYMKCDIKRGDLPCGSYVIMILQTSQEIDVYQIQAREDCFVGDSYLDIFDNEMSIAHSSEIGPPWDFPSTVRLRPNSSYIIYVHVKGRLCRHEIKIFSTTHSNVRFSGETIACDMTLRFW